MADEPAPARQSIILGVRPNKSEKTAVKFRIYTVCPCDTLLLLSASCAALIPRRTSAFPSYSTHTRTIATTLIRALYMYGRHRTGVN